MAEKTKIRKALNEDQWRLVEGALDDAIRYNSLGFAEGEAEEIEDLLSNLSQVRDSLSHQGDHASRYVKLSQEQINVLTHMVNDRINHLYHAESGTERPLHYRFGDVIKAEDDLSHEDITYKLNQMKELLSEFTVAETILVKR